MKARFTLIELLVVVAIIGILASMLLPALLNAKYMAQSAVCANNIKQVALACHMYADDNEEHIPPSPNLSPRWVKWWDIIGEVRNGNASLSKPEHTDGYIEFKRGEYGSGSFKCPAAGRIDNRWEYQDRWDCHFSLNSNLRGDSSGTPSKLSQFPRPVDTIFLGDGRLFESVGNGYYFGHTMSGGNSSVDADYLPYIWKYPDLKCHNSKVNLAFLDLHVEPISKRNPPETVIVRGSLVGDQWRKYWVNWGPY